MNTQGQRSQWEGTESDGEQWAAQHFQIGLEVLVSWELDSRGAIVIFWGKGDFSAAMAGREQPWKAMAQDSSCRNQREVGSKSLETRNVKPPGNLSLWEEDSAPEQ